MPRRQHLARLRDAAPLILPSLLLCDFGNLRDEVARLEDAGVAALHLDVMDGQFVPNFTYGMPVVEALRRLTDLPLDVHLMIATPERYIDEFFAAGADIITIHVEATNEPSSALKHIRDLGAGAGIAINPDTGLETIEECIDFCDLVLIMSVPAGFGGQPFHEVALTKLQQVRERAGSDVLVEVDGGINQSTIARCSKAGAQLFVVGSAIFRSDHYGTAVQELTELALAS